ncbi:SDR family NAD(P)-dependent oxidoreductase [Kineococcus gypseus]|uniref:SDR family NAD(P)-dependent oxidoreductase n=1 Tax=Kineococcus gypseus TaxID=1637102 RepID=UPI003D7E02A7
MTTVLVTGATRGLGLATARALRSRGAHVLAAGRSPAAVQVTAQRLGAEPVLLDLADLASVRAAVAALPGVDAVVCNAALNRPGTASATRDGLEEVLQVNHLAHLALVDALLARPRPPRRVVLLGSATHDPAVRTGTPDPEEDDDLARLARPGPPAATPRAARAAGARRYATTKLLATATAAALAREHPGAHVTCFDPGLMPGTGLARGQAPLVRLVWSTVARAARVLPFASSPRASGRALASLVLDEPAPAPSGAHVDHRLRVVPASARARDTAYQDAVLRSGRGVLAAAGSA